MTNLITLDTIQANAPIFRFHPNETCFPCSIEYILQGATLNQNTTPHMTPLPNPTFNLLAQYSSSDYFVAINPSQYHGMEQNGTITAPIYYAVQQVNQAGANEPAGNYPAVDIHYIVWYANQDGQTLKVFGAKAFNYSTLGISELFDLKNATDPMPIIVRTYGEHQGDQERVVVRLSLQNLQVLGVGYDAHGETQWQTPGQYPVQGTHPISYAALTGHSDHPIPDNAITHDYFVVESNQTVLEVGSVLSNAGIQWLPADYRFLGIDSAGVAIGPETWVKFTGYFGTYEEHSLESATYWNGQNLASVDWTYVQSVALGANIIGLLRSEERRV